MVENNSSKLPEFCYAVLPGSKEIIILKNNERGYYRTDIYSDSRESSIELVDEYNQNLGVTKGQREAMLIGTMFGFTVPGSDPDNYDEEGNYIAISKEEKEKDNGYSI